MAKTKDKVSDTAGSVRPYVERAIKDEELRENVKSAFTAARQVYDELLGDRGVTGIAARVATDQDIQDNLKTAVDELRQRGRPAPGQGGAQEQEHVLLLTGIALGILFNPLTGSDTRGFLKDKLFGGGSNDEFGYQGNSNN